MAKEEFSRAAGLHYKVPLELESLIKTATRNSFIPFVVAANILGSEGGFLTNNARSHTGAAGTAQFTAKTFLETAWLYRKDLPQPYRSIIEDNVERHNKAPKGSDPVYECRIKHNRSGDETGDKKAVLNLRNNPEVSILLGVKHMERTAEQGWEKFKNTLREKIEHIESHYKILPRERLERLNEELIRPMTAADLKIFYLCGTKGGASLLAANAEIGAKNHVAADYTTVGVARSNPAVFQKETGSTRMARSVPEFIEYIETRVGEDQINVQRAGKKRDFSENGEQMIAKNDTGKSHTPKPEAARPVDDPASNFSAIKKHPDGSVEYVLKPGQ